MAGISKPSIPFLGHEVPSAILDFHAAAGTSAYGLFDQNAANKWDSPTVFYLQTYNDFVELRIDEPCHIWRSGTASWARLAPFTIYRYENGWKDITSVYPQTITAISNGEWERTISYLPAGRYRFEGTGLRIDSEWYLESDEYTLIGSNELFVSQKNLLDILSQLFKKTSEVYAHEVYTQAEIEAAIDEVWR